MFAICAQSLRLKGARAQVLFQLELGLIDMMLDRDPGWDSIPILFPENTHNTPVSEDCDSAA